MGQGRQQVGWRLLLSFPRVASIVLGLVLIAETAGCSVESLKRHGIEVEGGKVKKRLLEF